MKIKYWTSFSKRKNSTLTPSGGTEIDAVLKGPTSELNPVFELQGVTSAKYVYCATFGRYYYVTDVVHLSNNVIQISCAVDVMSSFKGSIGGVYASIEYVNTTNAVQSWLKTIGDPRNIPSNNVDSLTTTIGSLNTLNTDSMCYTLGVVSNSGLNYYLMGNANLSVITDKLFSKDLWDALNESFYDPKSCIVSCTATPRVAPDTGYTNINIGGSLAPYTLGSGYKIADNSRIIRIYNATTSLNYPSTTYGTNTYLDYPPYTCGVLYLPFVGCVDLNTAVYADSKSIYVECYLDQITGEMLYKVGRSSSEILSTYSGCCGATCPIAGQSTDGVGVVSGIGMIVGGIGAIAASIASEGASAPFMAGMASATAGLTKEVQSLQIHTQVNGAISSFVGIGMGTDIKATIMTKVPAEFDITAYNPAIGSPYYRADLISNHSGYVKCNGASVSISGYDSEREEINGYLNSGFYYE